MFSCDLYYCEPAQDKVEPFDGKIYYFANTVETLL